MVVITARIGLVWRTVMEKRILWRWQVLIVLADQNPESIRMVSSPDAPARRTRPASSSTNRAAPRAVLAAPCAGGRATPRRYQHGWQQAGGSRGCGCSRRRRPACGSRAPGTPWSPGPWSSAHRPVRRRPPTPAESLLGEPVELADMPEGERAQEGPQRGGRHDPVA